MTHDKNWYALVINVASEASEAVEFALNELDSIGTEINHLGKERNEAVTVIGYFNEQLDDEKVRAQIDEALRIYGFSPEKVEKTDWKKVENADWLAEWKKHWKPTETGKFIIAPTWEKIAESGKIVIWIEPNMAFGTGTHETTRLCLKTVSDCYEREMSFLDVGTGTGILAIAAKIKQKKSEGEKITSKFDSKAQPEFLACDTDADSVKIAQENAELNNVSREIKFYVGSISNDTPKFDFVCANLTLDVILPILSLLLDKTRKVLILSGILKTQEDSIITELKKKGVASSSIETLGEWISVRIEK